MERIVTPTLEQLGFIKNKTHIGMLIDPDKQTPTEALLRTQEFINQGGETILIGGSGYIDPTLFNETVENIVSVTRDEKVIIFPGDIRQIPAEAYGITGVLNYSRIVGSMDSDSEAAYPAKAREYVNGKLVERKITSIPTLYILCGDERASVSKASGIKPVNLEYPMEQKRILEIITRHLRSSVSCVFFDTGSRSETSAPFDVIVEARKLIERYSPSALLFIGGGITEPKQATLYKGVVNCISIGTYFENNGATNTSEFIEALQ